MKRRHYATRLDEIPTDKHFAILYQRTICENTGYSGYENMSTPILEYVWFDDQESWEATISEETIRNTKFIPIVVNIAKVEVSVKTSVKID